ncbi:unnamed protein product [Fraxinus pennsylvanica]|uniref:Uncharacterized protein n=1 Tax=Fraxinus pennsylvanica TaxID=56036 RepID=A0AAD1YSG8_9LAMI|nr:unnamed protein product [Fraxinus pennsylvanica]
MLSTNRTDLSPDEAEDRMFWSLERSGCFSFRSCYRMIYNYIGQQQAGSSEGSTEKLLWKHLSKMIVPHKVKIFVWRACKDGLPTTLNLEKKHIIRLNICSLCNSETEDLNHAVINCKMLRGVWNNFFPELVNNNCRPIKDKALALCENNEVSKLDTFFMLLWSFWFRRNKYVHEQLWLDPRKIADNALGMLESFNKARKTNCAQIRKHFKWTPPDLNFLKLNVDGATFQELEKARIGAVLRDSFGKVIMAMSKIEIRVEESEAIELLAIFRGLQLCVNMGIQNLLVESDSKLVVEALQIERMLNSSLGVLYQEVKHLATQFVNCKYSHIYRECNMVAHKLARHAKLVDDICVWLDSIPDCVSQAIWLDNRL